MTPQEYLQRENEVQTAVRVYPKMEVTAAYMRWKAERGEVGTLLDSGDESVKRSELILKEGLKKPCTQVGCKGIMHLENICGGCVEGKRGYKSKFTCDECLHRELSKLTYPEQLEAYLNGR